jgi:hypothetical protein
LLKTVFFTNNIDKTGNDMGYAKNDYKETHCINDLPLYIIKFKHTIYIVFESTLFINFSVVLFCRRISFFEDKII